MPISLPSSGTLVGASRSVIAFTFSGSGLTPSALRTCPKYVSLFFLISHFSLFSFSPDSLIT